jgi:hypothetical protein
VLGLRPGREQRGPLAIDRESLATLLPEGPQERANAGNPEVVCASSTAATNALSAALCWR